MKKFSSFTFFCFLSIIVCAGVQAQEVTFCENLKCGERFAADGWMSMYSDTTNQGHGFYYEIISRGKRNFKVKTLAIVGGYAIHLDCERALPSQSACIDWLVSKGYQLRQDGSEPGGAGGSHYTTDRGPIYRIPAYLYSTK